ncbi:MAG: prepilin-type N-terminal cleavage/methylation domain-containing protein [Candidatus Faecimonas sp.]|nr:prepilin-type N-terminal cleavage/methylation domain-containing protein [Mycoplasmatota bacterium]MDY2907889.1 prepilin-type N-terminal cleavage/methylation domain-containing protein [Candidatus Faecimonas sp.]
MEQNKLNDKGFTLIELIVVIAIMGVILILALPQISRLQSANKDKKYDAYYSSIESAAKLYMDSQAKDLFGSNSSGCVTVDYSDLKKQNLVKDFGSSDVTCGQNNETYVEVRKVNDNFLYSTSLVCRDSKKVVYERKEVPTEPCTNEPDKAGPTVNITPSEHDWVQTKNLKIKIKITDAYTLNKNIGILYYWTNSSGTKVSNDYTYSYKNKKGVKSVSYQIPTKNIPTASGQYKLVVRQWISSSTNGIQDALGNQTVSDATAGLYKIDNVKPTCGSNDGKTTWTKDDFTIHQYCSDDASGCTENPYSKKFTSTTVTYTFTIKDNADNSNTCKVNVYLDKTNPTNPKGGAIGTVSGSNKSASIKTEVSGSTDSHSGFKRYLYLVTNSSSTPDKNDSRFTTSKTFTRSCGTSYYAWAVAEDNVGNRSSVVSLGNTKDGEDKYSDWSSCSKLCGTGSQSRTNTCDLVTTGLTQSCNTHSCVSVSVLHSSYYICPEDQLKPSRDRCVGGAYNALVISSVSVNGTKVTVKGHLRNNATYVTWNASDPNRTVCIATSGNTCKQDLCYFNVGNQGYAGPGADFCSFNTTIDVSGSTWTAGSYRVIVKSGGSAKWRFQTTPYMVDLFKVSK